MLGGSRTDEKQNILAGLLRMMSRRVARMGHGGGGGHMPPPKNFDLGSECA